MYVCIVDSYRYAVLHDVGSVDTSTSVLVHEDHHHDDDDDDVSC